MLLPPERLEHYTTNLGQHLQRLATSIRDYQANKALKTPQIVERANRLWELSQRYRLVKGTNEAAANALLAACQEVYEHIYRSILELVDQLANVSNQVTDFEREFQTFIEEQKDGRIPFSLNEFVEWLEDSLSSLQNQAKYLELHLRQLHPKLLVGDSTLEAFKADLQLPEHLEANISLGLAKIDRLSKHPLDL
ncbi:hypothetical protein KR009_012284, partial [Drosophila setifemur]